MTGGDQGDEVVADFLDERRLLDDEPVRQLLSISGPPFSGECMPLVTQYTGFAALISFSASAALVFLGSVSAWTIPLYLSSSLIVFSSAMASTIMSRPSSVLPMLQYRARFGAALAIASK